MQQIILDCLEWLQQTGWVDESSTIYQLSTWYPLYEDLRNKDIQDKYLNSYLLLLKSQLMGSRPEPVVISACSIQRLQIDQESWVSFKYGEGNV